MDTLHTLAQRLNSGALRSVELVEATLERCLDPAGEGGRTFVEIAAGSALKQAEAIDLLRSVQAAPSPFAGIPISLKDLFDVQGSVTRAGSKILRSTPPATHDAPAVARLRAMGLIFIGRSNMAEWAYSGLGLNPHYGTPSNPYERHQTPRAPGGSSSGAAVSVTDGLAAAGIGTDTGGSCRIPAAFCGITGFKPSRGRISTAGVTPLSASMDSVGSLAWSVSCCATLDAILRGESLIPPRVLPPWQREGMRLGIPQTHVLDGLDANVGRDFEAALSRLSKAGVRLVERPLRWLNQVEDLRQIITAEAYAVHRQRLTDSPAECDPRVRERILGAQSMDAATLLDLRARRAALIERYATEGSQEEALVFPTVPQIAPLLALFDAESDANAEENYRRLGVFVARNTAVTNVLDGCAISLPMHETGSAPTGLMLMAPHGADHQVLRVARTIEAILQAAA